MVAIHCACNENTQDCRRSTSCVFHAHASRRVVTHVACRETRAGIKQQRHSHGTAILKMFATCVYKTRPGHAPHANMPVARVLRMFCDTQHVRPLDATHVHVKTIVMCSMRMCSVCWSHMLHVATHTQDSSHKHIRVWLQFYRCLQYAFTKRNQDSRHTRIFLWLESCECFATRNM